MRRVDDHFHFPEDPQAQESLPGVMGLLHHLGPKQERFTLNLQPLTSSRTYVNQVLGLEYSGDFVGEQIILGPADPVDVDPLDHDLAQRSETRWQGQRSGSGTRQTAFIPLSGRNLTSLFSRTSCCGSRSTPGASMSSAWTPSSGPCIGRGSRLCNTQPAL